VQEDVGYCVIVVTHNHAVTLPACLRAAAALAPPAAEIVVVDNASSDRSADVAEDFDGVRLIREPGNIGFAAAVNRGIR